MHSRCVEIWTEVTIFMHLKCDPESYSDRLNLACGADYKDGWINQDFDDRVKADVYCDLDGITLPFADASFNLIYASHILEHIHNLQDLKSELYRILKPGGDLVCIVPHYLSVDAWGNPQHCRAFSLDSFKIRQFWPGEYLHIMQLFELNLKGENGYEAKWIISKRTKVA